MLTRGVFNFVQFFQYFITIKKNKQKTRDSDENLTISPQYMVGATSQTPQARSLPVPGLGLRNRWRDPSVPNLQSESVPGLSGHQSLSVWRAAP
jgi:hypothetical protein